MFEGNCRQPHKQTHTKSNELTNITTHEDDNADDEGNRL